MQNSILYNNNENQNNKKMNIIADVTICILLSIFVFLGIRYQYLLLNYREWGDESETLVTVKMMSSGLKLYSEIFNHHGPLTFLPGIITEMFGNFNVQGHRVFIAIIQILSVILIYNSPIIKGRTQRILVSIIVATLMLSYFPNIFGHMYKYQTIAGIFIVIILSQYTLPSIINQELIDKKRAFFGNLLIASLPFLAITYLPIAILLFFSSYRHSFNKYAFYGLLSALILNIAFLCMYGSIKGYLAFHIYLNAKILPLYNHSQPGFIYIVKVIRTLTSDITYFMSLIFLLASSLILARKESIFPLRTLLLVGGVVSLLIRGPGFHAMPYFYALLPFIALNFSVVKFESTTSKYITLFFLLLCTIKISLIIPGDKKEILSKPIPRETEFSQLVSELTNKEDKIIAYSFRNYEYLASDRLPASGHFFYLPWQKKYNDTPKFGILIDACKQIKEVRPKVMLIDKWKVWNQYPWDTYSECIEEFIDSNYLKIPNKPYYVRKDMIKNFNEYYSNEKHKLIVSHQLTKQNPIQLNTNKTYIGEKTDQSLVGIAIRFGTYKRVNEGTARLAINNKDGQTSYIDFSLSELKDNRYKYFPLKENKYVSGKIEWVTGGGISAWESQNDKGEILTCINYYLADGSIYYTPGCPLY
ncbi:hypothetical protein ACFO1V_09700 [Daeguia caeni]|uniref:Glycosyltransferase RgtA/B/C/D-like domain-containing protein n=1 Tax=Daeguia caeni TaxID=439612 RepID=A0ABV9H5J6_9HYPH